MLISRPGAVKALAEQGLAAHARFICRRRTRPQPLLGGAPFPIGGLRRGCQRRQLRIVLINLRKLGKSAAGAPTLDLKSAPAWPASRGEHGQVAGVSRCAFRHFFFFSLRLNSIITTITKYDTKIVILIASLPSKVGASQCGNWEEMHLQNKVRFRKALHHRHKFYLWFALDGVCHLY